MAGDWIIMRMDLQSDPAVLRIAAATGLDVFSVVGRLHKLWSWADTHTVTGRVDGIFAAQVDALCAQDGFAQAMQEADWLSVDERGICFPRFGLHNGKSSKRRHLTARRASRLRAQGVRKESRAPRTKRAPTEEKRREEERDNTEEAPALSDPFRHPVVISHPAPFLPAPGEKRPPDFASGPGAGPGRNGGPIPIERFLQVFLLRHAEAFGFSGPSLERQRRALTAIAVRMFERPDREERMAASVSLAWEKRQSGMHSPVKAWQAEMNRAYPKERAHSNGRAKAVGT